MYDVNDTGINKCYEGPARGTGVGHRIDPIEKKAYRTRREREVDRQARAKNERNALYAGAGASGILGASLIGRKLGKPAVRSALKTARQAVGGEFFPKKTIALAPGKSKEMRLPSNSLLAGTAAVSAAPAFYTTGQKIDRHMSEEWR